MIDLSLRAIVDRRRWDGQPNRADIPNVDLPFGGGIPSYAPANKPRQRREAPYKSPEIPKDKVSADLTLRAEAMSQRYGQVAPIVTARKREGALTGEARVGLGRLGGPNGPIFRSHGGEVRVGARSGGSPQEIGALYHEVGHVIHAQRLAGKGHELKGIAPFQGTPSSYSDEHAATLLARREIKLSLPSKGGAQAKANWTLAYGLHTYRKGWESRGKPVKVDKDGNITGGSF